MGELNKTYKAFYRRNNQGQPCVWTIEELTVNTIHITYGILGKTITKETIHTTPRSGTDEAKTRINTKRKNGYLQLHEVTDQNILPVEEVDVIHYLNTYLPHDRQSSTGAMLPMLAKLYDNTNNKLFKDGKSWIAQPKINGLRCLIGAKEVFGNIFANFKFTFQSREGTYWDSLDNLGEYLAKVLPKELIDKMINENYLLDGELYLPGLSVNEINSCVKNVEVDGNRNLQYWCYDIAISEMSQTKRLDLLNKYIGYYSFDIDTYNKYTILPNRLVCLPDWKCTNNYQSTHFRNKFINWDFEGLILRDPNAEYQFGKRNSTMHKYKSITDGKFNIIDIKSEGDKRADIPLLVLKNDINSSTFNVHITGSFDYQRDILINKNKYIGRTVFVEYGERSGVNQLPFHVKTVTLLEE